MAVTYRARDLLLNRTVAVKLMREQFTTDPQFVERFRREAQAAARLSHENIASVYDTGRANGAYYIVMEFVEGTDLKQRLRRDGALPVLTALEIGRQIAAALDAAHRGGLVHRDIKPHNILLNQDDKVKVTDFGIAKLSSEGEDTGVIIGSVHYVSPEQARGEVTTPSSDLYSLGAVLFEILTGRTVFEADNAMAVAHKQIYDRPPLPRTLRPEIPPAVESMVLRCLEKDPRARYQSAAELQAVLARLSNQLAQEETIVITPQAPSMDATMVFTSPVGVPPSSTPSSDPFLSPTPPPRRERQGGGGGWFIGFVFVLLAIAVGAGAYWLLMPRQTGEQNPGSPEKMVSMPKLVGLTEQRALAELERLGLRPDKTTESSEKVAKGKVIRQSPDESTNIAVGTSVTLWVSDGPPKFPLPDVKGKTQTEATALLKDAGFTGALSVKQEASDLPKGQVTRTSPAAGTLQLPKTKITLFISNSVPSTAQVPVTFRSVIPSIPGADQVMIRLEIERAGGEPGLLMETTGKAGDPVEYPFTRGANERVVVRMWAGKDAESLQDIDDQSYGPGTDSAQ